MRITVSGLPGSGTTSLARYLEKKHGFTMISAGEVFRQLAKEHNMELAEFGRLAESDASFDKMIDARQKEIAEANDNIIVEGRLSGWMVPQADLKIWLHAPPTPPPPPPPPPPPTPPPPPHRYGAGSSASPPAMRLSMRRRQRG
jgi:predicted cytidylate kinase